MNVQRVLISVMLMQFVQILLEVIYVNVEQDLQEMG